MRTGPSNEHRALNKSQLAAVLGYTRQQVAALQLPFQQGKLSPHDARRILRRRQDAAEAARIGLQRGALVAEDDPRWQEIERRFYGDGSRKG
jgi:hypothetical protein